MAYYLSYILNSDNKWGGPSHKMPKGLYHASLALTEHNPPEAPKIVAKAGFFGSSQIELEDRITTGERRKFYHKTYPITQEQMTAFMHKINQDRRIGTDFEKEVKNNQKLYPELNVAKENYRTSPSGTVVERQFYQLDSIPGGPKYNFLPFNCKTYALSVMKAIDIVDKSLNNWLIDDPGTGKLIPFEFALHPDTMQAANGILVWKTPMKVSAAVNLKQLKNLTLDEAQELQFSIKVNQFEGFLKNSLPLLENLNPKKIAGVEALVARFKSIESQVEELSAQYHGYHDYIQNGLKNIKQENLKEEIVSGLAKHEKLAFNNYLKQHEGENLRKVCKNFLDYLKEKKLDKAYQSWLQQAETAVIDFEKINAKQPGLRKTISHALKRALNYLSAHFKISSEYKAKTLLHDFKRLTITPEKENLLNTGQTLTSKPKLR